jgi:pimeloyl-ACP methyl ester carboxylesterase
MMELNFYLIPGMGADSRLYQRYQLPGKIHFIQWVHPKNSRTLGDYSKMIAEQVTTKNNVIIGSSMGGMLATELSRHISTLATILLSAPIGRQQFPWFLKAISASRVHNLISPRGIMRLVKICDVFMGFKSKEQRALFYEMLHSNGADFLHFNVRAVLDWSNIHPPTGDYIQIIGDRDFLFDVSRIPDAIALKGSGHFTTFEKSDEICGIIRDELVRRNFINE